ncbi:MAG: 30S ribosomal protein S12 methylthiotransferase accessory factor YcaO [Burkholderiales bacterium]
MTEHFIIGKDAALETTITALQTRLAALDFSIEERSWLNPVSDVWSVHIRDSDCPLLFTNGKGASKLAALASALGEFFERLGTHYFWTHYYLGNTIAQQPFVHFPQERWFPVDEDGAWPEEILNTALREFYDPDYAIDAGALIDRNSGNAARGICALPYRRASDNETCWFPVNIIGNLYVSNGMAAGNTAAEARTQALSEILERHVKFRVIREGLCLPDVPESIIGRYPGIAKSIAELRAAGFGILVKDATLGGNYPVMNVTMLHPHDQGCFASFGAHPRFEVALERALTELLQGRDLDALAGFHEPGFDMEEIADPQNLEIHFVDSSGIISWRFLSDRPDFAFADWDFRGTTTEEFGWLCGLIHKTGHDIYIADYAELGVYSCRIIVPGMSEIYPVDDLEWDNNSVANELRPAILNLSRLNDDECRALLDALNELGITDQQPVAPFIGLAAEPDSHWKDLRIGELKTLLALALTDTEATLEGCDWIRSFAQINADRRKLYRCISTLLTMDDAEPYRASLELLYGENTVRQARALLGGKNRFMELGAPGMDLDGCELHQRLLAAYRKVCSPLVQA